MWDEEAGKDRERGNEGENKEKGEKRMFIDKIQSQTLLDALYS